MDTAKPKVKIPKFSKAGLMKTQKAQRDCPHGHKRKSRGRQRWRKVPLLIFFLCSFPIWVGGPSRGSESSSVIIEIRGENKQEIVLEMPVKEGAILTLAYTHSLFLTPQEEHYTIQAGSLILREINFGSLEAAGYYDPHPRGGLHLEGNLWKTKLSCPVRFSLLRMRIPYNAPLRLIISGSVVWTSEEREGGALLIVRIRPGG